MPIAKKAAPAAVSAPAKAGPAATTPVASDAASRARKPKLVRDSFTMPKAEYAAIDALKQRAQAWGLAPKKSELLRAGVLLLGSLSDAMLKRALAAVPALKTGRPKVEVTTTAAAESVAVAPRKRRTVAKKSV